VFGFLGCPPVVKATVVMRRISLLCEALKRGLRGFVLGLGDPALWRYLLAFAERSREARADVFACLFGFLVALD
jgi:hypothetical protein